MVDAFGDKEDDWSRWHITPDGALVLGENDHFETEETVWYSRGDRLVAYEQGENGSAVESKGMVLVRVRD
jgi:hypothetical protein